MILSWFNTNPHAVILVITAFASYLFSIPRHLHPFTLYYLAQSNLAKRLYHKNDSINYQYGASTAALLLSLTITCTLIFGLIRFAYYPILLEAVLLFLCISNPLAKNTLSRIPSLFINQQNAVIKQLIKPWLRRDVTNLSTGGLMKAIIEMKVLRTVRDLFIPLFIYYFINIEATFCYRLLVLTHNSWSQTCQVDSPFIKITSHITFIIDFIPLRLFSLLLAFSHLKKAMQLIQLHTKGFYNRNTAWLLCAVSASLQCQLGGPCYYNSIRFEKMRISRFPVPNIDHLKYINTLLNKVILIFIVFVIVLEVLYAALS